MNTLNGKVAVVTGASRGLGKAIAMLFAQEGAQVVLAARSQKDIEQIAADLRAEGHTAVTFPCDVSDPQQVEALARFHLNLWALRCMGQ